MQTNHILAGSDRALDGWPHWSILVVDDEPGMLNFLVKTLAPRCHFVMSASSAEDGARALFASVRRLKQLPDHIEVLPGAYSGSVCGRALSGKPTSTIGFEKRFNKAFRIADEDEFVAAMVADIPPPPPEAARTRALNAGAAR